MGSVSPFRGSPGAGRLTESQAGKLKSLEKTARERGGSEETSREALSREDWEILTSLGNKLDATALLFARVGPGGQTCPKDEVVLRRCGPRKQPPETNNSPLA